MGNNSGTNMLWGLTTAGRLHHDTAYGLTGEKDGKANDFVVHRVALIALRKKSGIEGRVLDPGSGDRAMTAR
jgi:hypothetical protein